jgi:hypothetical protein
VYASQFIELLGGLIDQHGDNIIVDEHNHAVDNPEFNDDDGDPCFLISFVNAPIARVFLFSV